MNSMSSPEWVVRLAEDVAKEVGGAFWKTHILNTGLLKLIKRLGGPLTQDCSPNWDAFLSDGNATYAGKSYMTSQ